MHYRPFGSTGLSVSAVGFGCGRVGGLLVNGTVEDQRRAFARGLDGGINWFDTAEAYGSEAALGQLLASTSASLHVSTKLTLKAGSTDLVADIETQTDACLKRLQRDHVTVLQVHNRIDDSGAGNALTVSQMLGEVAAGLERMREKGKVRFIGLTALGESGGVLRTIESGRFHSAQIYYNLVNPSAARAMPANWTGQNFAGVLDAVARLGMGTLGIRVLDGGIIATDERARPVSMMARETSEAIEQDRTHMCLAALAKACGDTGTRAQTGLRFALSQSRLSLALVGIGEPGHVDSALAGEAMGALPPTAFDALEQIYTNNFQA